MLIKAEPMLVRCAQTRPVAKSFSITSTSRFWQSASSTSICGSNTFIRRFNRFSQKSPVLPLFWTVVPWEIPFLPCVFHTASRRWNSSPEPFVARFWGWSMGLRDATLPSATSQVWLRCLRGRATRTCCNQQPGRERHSFRKVKPFASMQEVIKIRRYGDMTYDAGREVDGARRARPGVGAKGAKGNTEQPESVRSWPNLPPASPCGSRNSPKSSA
jgi:hypothetical protein